MTEIKSDIKMKEKTSASEKINGFLENNKVLLFVVLGVFVAALVVFIVSVNVSSKATEKTLAAVDEITYTLTKDAAGLEESEVSARVDAALEALQPYVTKGGVGGVRANMLAAELSFQKKDFEKALAFWTKASSAKKSYTAPLCYYNMAVCAEELGNTDLAVENYKKAVENKDFTLKTHAQFSLGRVYETKGDTEKALETYNALINESPDDSWAKVAKSRVLSLNLN